ncbi:hypothetical protein MIMGU_mgv1a020949mg, partial [Erythranthe guttata]
KMNMATVLEEAYRYIKFLQAQVSALQSMPCQSGRATSGAGVPATRIGGGDLGRLNRLNIPRPHKIQVLSSNLVCVCSIFNNFLCEFWGICI